MHIDEDLRVVHALAPAPDGCSCAGGVDAVCLGAAARDWHRGTRAQCEGPQRCTFGDPACNCIGAKRLLSAKAARAKLCRHHPERNQFWKPTLVTYPIGFICLEKGPTYSEKGPVNLKRDLYVSKRACMSRKEPCVFRKGLCQFEKSPVCLEKSLYVSERALRITKRALSI